MKALSDLFRLQPEHPMDRAIFWVEKVIKLKDFRHLQSPALHMNSYQLFYLDIIGAGVAIALLHYLLYRYHSKRSERRALEEAERAEINANIDRTVAEVKKEN